MDRILDFHLSEVIYSSKTSLIYRGVSLPAYSPVIIKRLRQTQPSPGDVSDLQQECRMTGALADLEGVSRIVDLIKYKNYLFTVSEDFGGTSLDLVMKKNVFRLDDAMRLAIRLCAILGDIHSRSVIHGGLSPSNVIVNQRSDIIKVIDFSHASYFTEYPQLITDPEKHWQDLRYISPEQTGRINRPMDFRSDYYSLGVTFYELFTGGVPFESEDALELVHSHLAKNPVLPHERNPEIPVCLSEVIMKLMAKNAEDRYQSSYGIKDDLEMCLDQLKDPKSGKSFRVGLHDIPERFVIPTRLYGRESELAALRNSSELVASGARKITLITGPAGIGKTSLVNELYRDIASKKGHFVSGKFDQLYKNVPNGSVITPFKSLVHQILAGSEESLQNWKRSITEALGVNCRVIIDVIPEIELVVGPQPPVPDLEPLEAQSRFRIVFQEFIRVFCRVESPLLIFLDDLQWADLSSLKMLELIMTDSETGHLHLVAAYRDDEVDQTHPLKMTLDAVCKSGTTPEEIFLQPLAVEDSCSLLSDTLRRDSQVVADLGNLLHRKTGGNPFFMREFLRSLYESGLLEFDLSSGCWTWDFDRIQKLTITDNVATLMTSRIRKLPALCRDFLTYGACLGTQFGINPLSQAIGTTPTIVMNVLGAAVIEGLVFPVHENSEWLATNPENHCNATGLEYKFSHDKIQAAVLNEVPDKDRSLIHEKLGRTILKQTPADQLDKMIFDIVNQLNLAVERITEPDHKLELANLNFKAGLRAKLTSAYEVAFNYFKEGINLLGRNGWVGNYELTLNLHVEAAESCYLISNFEEMESLGSVVLGMAGNLLDKVKIYEVKIQACIARNNRGEAVRTALPILAMLDNKFPEKPSKFRVVVELLRVKALLALSGWEKEVASKKMTAPYKIAAMRIMAKVLPAAYTVTPNLFPVIIFRMVWLTVRYGSAPPSATALAAYGLILCSGAGDADSGYHYGKMALNDLERLGDKDDFSKINFIFNSFIRIRREPLRDGLQPLRNGYFAGMEVGDLEYASLSGAFYCTQGYAAGRELTELEGELSTFSKAVGKLNQQTTHYLSLLYHQSVLNLVRDTPNPTKLVGDSFNEDKILPSMFELNERAIILATYLHKLILAYLFGRYEEASRNAEMVESYLDGAQGTVIIPLAALYGSLARIACLHDVDPDLKKSFLLKIKRNQAILKKWAADAPMNYLNKYNLVQAEILRYQDEPHGAMDCYEQAISLARENEFLNEEALALERTAIFHDSLARTTIAKAYFYEAKQAYIRWGASSKVKDLEKNCPYFWDDNVSVSPLKALEPPHGDQKTSSSLDISAVLKASQALSGEIVLKDLLHRLMTLVLEIAGAERGFLIIPENDVMMIRAKADTVSSVDFFDKPLRVSEDNDELAVSLLHYVTRLRDTVIIDDAKSDLTFLHDVYIQNHSPRSLCCIPILRSNSLSAILYLENNKTEGVFSQQRVEMLKVLSSQAAISIENAMLYKDLDKSATRYRSLIENAQETIMIFQHGRVKFFNPAAMELTGYNEEELASLLVVHFFHPDDLQKFIDRDVRAVTEEMAPQLTTFRALKKDDSVIWVQLNSVVVMWDDKPATLNFITDITELKAAADINLRTERLSAVGELAAGVAHNFNNLLQVIMSAVELSIKDLNSHHLSNISGRLELIRESSRFGSETVKRLQSFAQIRKEDNSVRTEVFNLSELVKQAVRMSTPWWKTNPEKEGIHVEVQHDLENECPVLGKESEVFEVLINLIKNSAEAMPGGGKIFINTYIKDNLVHLKISDTGTGISEENLKRLFEPFFTTKGSAGTGLGLAVSHGIITGHGGTISVTSRLGHGTIFLISLPEAQASETRSEALSSEIDDLQLKILLIDDSAPALMLLNDLLTANNQTVYSALSGLEGLKIFHAEKIDLVICDLGMPKMSGWDVGKALKNSCEGRSCAKTPFVLLTGWGGQSFEESKIAESGVDAVLEKPIDIQKLFRVIRSFSGPR